MAWPNRKVSRKSTGLSVLKRDGGISVDKQQISDFIHVKDPYLWLDEVLQLDDQVVTCRKFIDPELELFQAHYEGFPLFPGALQCEACFQASNVLLTKLLPENPGYLPVIARVRNVKFKRMVRPNDTMDIRVEITGRESKAIFLRGRCSVAGETTTSLDFVATEAKKPE